MFNKGLATVYILIYGSLLILSVIVTFSTFGVMRQHVGG